MKTILCLLFLMFSIPLLAQTNVPPVTNSISIPTAAEDFAHGFSALGFNVSASGIEKLIALAFIIGKLYVKYGPKNETAVGTKIAKALAIEPVQKTTTTPPNHS